MDTIRGHELHGARQVGRWPAAVLVDLWGRACSGVVKHAFVIESVYIARQLMTMQNGTSAGANAALMKKVVVSLSEDDIIALSAYLGSLPPR